MGEITLDANGFAETDGSLTVHNYAQATGEYTGSAPVYLAKGVGIPANSTTTAPMVVKDGFAQVFSGHTWSYVEDHRGQIIYNKSNGAPFTVTTLGSIDDTTYTADKPPAPVVSLKDQAISENAGWIRSQINDAAAMGETFTDTMKAYVKAVRAIADGSDTTSVVLPARPDSTTN